MYSRSLKLHSSPMPTEVLKAFCWIIRFYDLYLQCLKGQSSVSALFFEKSVKTISQMENCWIGKTDGRGEIKKRQDLESMAWQMADPQKNERLIEWKRLLLSKI